MTIPGLPPPSDLGLIHPARDDKYSPNLHRYLKRHRQPGALRVCHSSQGLMIGAFDAAGWFYGRRLYTVLCQTRTQDLAYSPKQQAHLKLRPLKHFWKRYASLGRCAIDPQHTQHFTSSHSRYESTGKSTRICKWCGQKQKRRIRQEIVKHEVWTNHVAQASRLIL